MEKVLTFSQIDELAKKLANYVEENTVIALIGELGTGKTTFTKTFAKEFGVKENLKVPHSIMFLNIYQVECHYTTLMYTDCVIRKKSMK